MAFDQSFESRLSTLMEGEESSIFRKLQHSKEEMEAVAALEESVPSELREQSDELDANMKANNMLISTARELMEEKQWIAAEGILKNVINDDPAHKEAHNLLGIVLSSGDVRHARYDEALTQLAQVLKLDPTESERRKIKTLMGKINKAMNMKGRARLFCCCTYTIDNISSLDPSDN